MTHHDDDKTTFRALLSSSDFATLDTFKLDTYGDGMDGIDNGDSIPCRLLEPSQADSDAVGHGALVGSDYSGGALVRSNLKAFRTLVEEETGDGPPLPIVDYYGGYGTDGVLLLLDREHDIEKLRPFVELLQGLEDYPVVCEDTMSEVEHEDEDEAWSNYAEGDFAKALAEHIGQDTEIEDPDTDVYPNALTLRELFHATADSENLNGGPGVIHEESGAYFMVDDAAKAVSPVLLFGFGFVKLDADTMLELASSTDEEDHDQARRIFRLSRLGLGLRQARDFLAREITTQTARRQRAALPEGDNLSNKAFQAIEEEAGRQARELFLRAEIDAGDTSAPIGAAGLNRPQRIATVKLDRFHWGLGRTPTMIEAEIELDPASPYDVGREALRDFVASF